MQDSERDRLTVEVCEAVSAISPAGSHLATTAARLREMVGQEVPAGDYMKEAERLLDEFYLHVSATVSSALADEWSEVEAAQRRSVRARAALLAHIQRGAVPEGDDGKRVLRWIEHNDIDGTIASEIRNYFED